MSRLVLPDADSALRVVGLSVREVLDLGGSVLSAGPAHLVGSLAGGLGNRGSDVDVHMFVSGVDKPTPAYLFFAGDTPVDVEHYPPGMPAQVLAAARAHPVRELPLGVVSLAPPPGRRLRRTASRWLCSVPLRPDTPPVFEPDQAALVLPILVRAALEQLVQFWAVARLAAVARPAAAAYLWQRAGRTLLELRCRAVGDVLTGEKWLPDRAARLGLPPAEVAAHYAVDTEPALVAMLAGTGLSTWDPWRLALLVAQPLTEVRVGRQVLWGNRHQRLLANPCTAAGYLGDEVARWPAVRLLDAVSGGEIAVDVCPTALAEVIDGS